jgi:hypothetical protein
MSRNILIIILLTYCLLNTAVSQSPRPMTSFRRQFYCSPGNLLIWDTNNTISAIKSDKEQLKIEPDSEILDIAVYKEGSSDKIAIVLRSKILFSNNCGFDVKESKIAGSYFLSFKFNKYNPELGIALVSGGGNNNELQVTKTFGYTWWKLTTGVLSYFW